MIQVFYSSNLKSFNKIHNVINDSLMYGVYPEEQYIQAKHWAYRFMKMNNTWTSEASQNLSDFYAQSEAGNIGLFATVEGFLGEGKWQEAKMQLDEIKPENNIEENYKNYFLAYVNMKTGLFSTTDSLHINGLVFGCSKRDGEVVHHARVLHRILYKDFETYYDNCPDVKGIKRSNNDISESNNLLVYPNPSTGEVWISTDEQGAANIEILTLNGSLVYAAEVVEISGNTKLSVDLRNGVYLLVVKTNARKYTNRVVVIN